MTTGMFGEGMPEYTEVPEVSELPELMLAVDSYDQANALFLEQCKTFIDCNSETNAQTVGQTCCDVATTFDKAVRSLATSEPAYELRVPMLTTLFLEGDATRVSFFKEHVSTDGFSFLRDVKDLHEELIEAAIGVDDGDDFNNAVAKSHSEYLAIDLRVFFETIGIDPSKDTPEQLDPEIEAAPSIQEQPPLLTEREYYAMRRREIAQTVGMNALEVAKISAGVALGIWVARKIIR